MSIQKPIHNFPIEYETVILSSTLDEPSEKLPVKKIYVDPNTGNLVIEYDDGRGIPAAVDDPDFASVVLLLDFAGVDGATETTDLSNSAHTAVFRNGAEIDTGNMYLATNSLLLPNTNSERITFADDDDWDFGTGDFTMEIGAYFDRTDISMAMLSQYDGTGGTGVYLQLIGGSSLLKLGWGTSILISETWAPSISTWYHVAVCRSGTDLRLFVDGVQVGSTATDSTNMTGAIKKFFVGALRDDAIAQVFAGALAAVRITKGVARYTENFTPPTEFYPTS